MGDIPGQLPHQLELLGLHEALMRSFQFLGPLLDARFKIAIELCQFSDQASMRQRCRGCLRQRLKNGHFMGVGMAD